MATLPTMYPTLMDVAKTLDPNGKVDKIVEVLKQTNEMLEDMVWKEGNLPTGHRTTIRTGIPEPSFRKLYGFVQPTKTTTAQVTEACGMLEDYSVVDKALADLNGNTSAYRLQQDMAKLQGFNNKLARSIFYESESSTPGGFTGLAPRFSTKAASAANRDNIILEGDTTPDNADNASIWLIVWGEDKCCGIYPKGSVAGWQQNDKGQVTDVDGNGGLREVYRTHYRWDCGISVEDWRYVVRIQYNAEDLIKTGATGPDLIDLMTQALEVPPDLQSGRPAFYMNRRARSFLRRQMVEKVKQSTLLMSEVGGKHVLTFDGIPVRRSDALLNAETGIPTS
jgi:hypothetical protein